MSDSELSDAPSDNIPADSVIESSLIKEVKKAAKGPAEAYTVGKIRTATEKSLGLTEGFFKGDEKWKDRSKAIIKVQVEKEAETAGTTETQQDSSSNGNPKRPAKRTSPKEPSKPNKKRKIDSEEETSALSSPPSDSEDDLEEEEEVKPKKSTKAKKETAKAKAKSLPKPKPKSKPKQNPKSKSKLKPDMSDVEDDVDENNESDDAQEKDGGSESEMSVILDEAPVKKQRSKSTGTDASGPKSKPKSKASTEPDADQEEIKRLQGWLVKCGVRKVWGKELKPFDTSKAKIKHLKSMLEEVGMTGRYSNEKAAGIKEARELAADIEAVQEGNERWGKDGEDDDGDGDKTRGGRRLVRGAKNYDFLSSDGEETD